MLRTAVVTALGLLVAAGGPVVYYSAADYFKASPAAVSKMPPAGPSKGAVPGTVPVATRKAPPGPESDDRSTEGPLVHDLAEALRFDLTPGWILAHWPRVSTGMGQLQLQGYRVPLVTGTAEDDLAGALTYYFNPQQQLQRITFFGTTGNAQKLVAFLTARYSFTRRIVNDAGLLVYEVPELAGPPKSTLQVQAAKVVKTSEPHQRFSVNLLMERPEAR